MSRPGLFAEPEPEMPKLSARFGGGEYRAGPGIKVRWSRRAPRARADCDECAALQHETRGQFWPRRQVRLRRVAGETTLDLCSAHAAAWKDRDALDGAH